MKTLGILQKLGKALSNRAVRNPKKLGIIAIILFVLSIGTFAFADYQGHINAQLTSAAGSGVSTGNSFSTLVPNPTPSPTSAPATTTSDNSSADQQANAAIAQAQADAQKEQFDTNCQNQATSAWNTYSNATDSAQSAYNSVMAQWYAVENQPYQTHPPESEYLANAESQYNAIYGPAWTTYGNTINSLKTQGCDVMNFAGPEGLYQ